MPRVPGPRHGSINPPPLFETQYRKPSIEFVRTRRRQSYLVAGGNQNPSPPLSAAARSYRRGTAATTWAKSLTGAGLLDSTLPWGKGVVQSGFSTAMLLQASVT